MRITPRQHIQAAKKPKKANPMARARVARQVPQMRKVFKGVTGVKKGGQMANPKKFDRMVSKYESALTKKNKNNLAADEVSVANLIKKDKDMAAYFSERARKGAAEILKMLKEGNVRVGKRAGGVIRPKPTFKGKVLKPKPIKDKRGIGIAIRGIGKAFKKGN